MTIRPLLIGSLAMAGIVGCQSQNTSERKERAAMQVVEQTERPTKTNDTRVTSSDGTQIAFEKVGRGPALIVVSGALSHRALLRDNALAPQLAEHFTVYTYDRRGRGESTDVKPYAVQREIEDLDALIEHAGGSAYLYGVSSGAALAMQAAATLGPAKVTRLALYEPPYGQQPAAFAKQKQGVKKRVETGKPGDAAEFFLTAIGTPREGLEGMKQSPDWDAIAKMDFTLAYDFEVLGDGAIPTDTARAIRVPTLVMNGDQSMPFMQSTADALAKQLRDAKRKTLAGQTHQAQGEVVAPVLIEFFTPASS
jgi:pimeloyl-ACP methyl ester carboxylesterase